MNKVIGRIIVSFFAISVIGTVQAGGGPASKAAAAYKDISVLSTLEVDAGYMVREGYLGSDCSVPTPEELENGDCVFDPVAMANSKHRILRTMIKAPGNSSLAMDVSLECGNFAKVSVKSGRAKLGKMKGSSSVRVAVVITDNEGNSVFAEPHYKDGNPGVTFCQNRTGLQATFAGLFAADTEPTLVVEVLEDNNGDGDLGTFVPLGSCDAGQAAVYEPVDSADCSVEANQDDEALCTLVTEEILADVCAGEEEAIASVGTCLVQGEDGAIIADTECFEPEEIKLMSSQMSANAFNYFYTPGEDDKKGSTLRQIDVIAWVQNKIKRGKPTKGKVGATIGLGSMFVESVRMVKGHNGKDDSDVEDCSFDNEAACTELTDDD